MVRLDNVWGVGGGIKPVKYLVSSGVTYFLAVFFQSFGSVFIWYGYGSSILGWIPIRIKSGSMVLRTNNWKIYNWKNFNFFFIENYSLPIPRFPERTFKLQKSSALKREHPAHQNMKIFIFVSIFVGHFCPPGSESGFYTLVFTLLSSIVDQKKFFTNPDSRMVGLDPGG